MIVGLTGGVASGKNLVAEELERLGAVVIDADLVAREITKPGTPAYREIVRRFGEKILMPDGSINRKALGEIVFSDPNELKALNGITHPPIIREIERRIEELRRKDPGAVVVLNAPLLIEVGLYRKMDKVVVVYADEKRQIERMMKRDEITRKEAVKRVRAQMPLKKKLDFADYVIDNNGSKERTREQTRKLYSMLSD